MSENRQVYVIAGLLTLLAIGWFLYKVVALDFPLTGKQHTEVWQVEVHVVAQGQGGPAKFDLIVPKNTRRYLVVDEAFISRGYGLDIRERKDNRHAIWTVREARGRQDLFYRATVRFLDKSEAGTGADEDPATIGGGKDRATAHAQRALIDEVRKRSSDSGSFVSVLLQFLNNPQPDANTVVLLGKKPDQEKRMRVAVDTLRSAGIAARVVHGIVLSESRANVPVKRWLQILDDRVWRSVDPETGQIGIPDNYFTWWRGDARLFRARGVTGAGMTISISPSNLPALETVTDGRLLRMVGVPGLSLLSLPLETQLVYRILLTIPIGALLLVVLRNVVGIRTFGTFMPVLIALAFRETQLIWGLVLFSLVVSLGLVVRFYFEHLRLLLVPRLASVLIVVVLLMAGLSVVSHALGLERGLSVALFPMVILTMTIERMSIVWEERGRRDALIQGLGSLVAAAISYLAMTARTVEHLVFVFPELLLLVLAATLLLGRYTGYRLTELYRFRAFARDRVDE